MCECFSKTIIISPCKTIFGGYRLSTYKNSRANSIYNFDFIRPVHSERSTKNRDNVHLFFEIYNLICLSLCVYITPYSFKRVYGRLIKMPFLYDFSFVTFFVDDLFNYAYHTRLLTLSTEHIQTLFAIIINVNNEENRENTHRANEKKSLRFYFHR